MILSNLFILYFLLTTTTSGPFNIMEDTTKKIIPAGEDWKTLTQDNYSFQYPSNWELDTSGQLGTSFILFSPQESEEDPFQENVNLLIQDLTGMNIDLDQFTAISEEQVKSLGTNSNLIESKRMKSGNTAYQKIIYTADQGLFHLQHEQYYWMINEHAYILTLTTEQHQFDNYKETGERILNSFTFTKE